MVSVVRSVVTLRFRIALVIFATLAMCAGTSRAAPRTFVALEYEVSPEADGCPDIEEFRASVGRQLGYDPFQSAADRRVEVRIARKGTGFDGSIKWRDARGHRVGDRGLSSRSSECSEIAANVAFAVAVQIQLLATFAQTTPEPSESSTPSDATPPATPTPEPNAAPSAPDAGAESATKPKETEAPATPPSRSAARRKPFGLSAGIGPSLALGIAPQATGLGRIFVRGRIDPLSLELAVDGALPVTEQEADGSGFKLNRFAAGAAACGHIQWLAGCLTGTLGRLAARGFGVDQPASPSGLFSQVGLRVLATLDLGRRYFVSARAEGLVILSPWSVTLSDTVVWTTPRVGELLGLDFGLNFF
jgi:hypothetical protein